MQPCETGSDADNNDGVRGYKWDLHNTGCITDMGGVVLGSTGEVDADADGAERYDALGLPFNGSAIIGSIDAGISNAPA